MVNIQEKLLKILIENKKPYSINELSKIAKSDYKLVHTNVKKLLEKKLIIQNKLGNTSQIQFAFKFDDLILKVENDRRDKISKNKYIKAIIRNLLKIENPFSIVLLFGSYAKGTQNKNSDVDICIISDNKEITRNIEMNLRLLPINLHIIDFTIEEFSSMLNSKRESVATEIVKNNIILSGIENYYRLIERYY